VGQQRPVHRFSEKSFLMRVVIIGAGLGGLTLLHGLRAAGIDARVYERSANDGAQPASYGIHLDADGLAALHACLPDANWKMIDAAGVPAPYVIRFRDPRRGLLSTVDRRFPENETDPVTKRRAISRGRLRDALLLGTHDDDGTGDPVVHWGKRFLRYENHGGQVRACFEDGTHADGDLLVGADGSNSRVREQRLPDLQREDLGILNLAGRTPLTEELARKLTPDMIDGGINNVVPAGAGWMFFSTWDTGDPDITDYSAGARQYVIWAWAAARASYPAAIDQMAADERKTLVHGYIRNWDPKFRALVEHTDPETIGLVPLRTMPQLPDWRPSNVTVLGDAIHNMTPMAGIGANTALRDADQLRRALSIAPESITNAVGHYEKAMRAYANQALALSTRNATGAARSSPTARTAFRAVLRAGSAFPPLKRKMFGPTSA
jgi:2-polyprenyl-6-methoxyphenol hydroxylase-like FAD-dependent oxidoreductase